MSTSISRRRFLTASAAAAATVALSACGATPTATRVPPTATKPAAAATAAPAAPTAAPTVAAKPVIQVVVASGQHPSQPIISDAPAHLEVTKYTNVKMDFQPVPSADYDAKQKIWMSTKQVPDLMKSGFNAIRDYANPGTFKPVLPLIDKYGPNLKRYLDAYASDVKKMKMNGDLYVVPATSLRTKLLAPMPCIRKDLVEKAGMKLPTNFHELYNVLKELKKVNAASIGWTARRSGTPSGIKRTLMIFAYPFGSGQGGWARGIDGPYWEKDEKKWVYGALRPEYKEVLSYFNKLYKEGLCDPDIANTTPDQWHEKNGSGKGVFCWDNFSFCVNWNKAVRGADAKATWTPIPIIAGSKGARQNDYSGFAGSGGGWTISANCKNPERAIELMDWMVTPLGIDLRSWGIQDVHYTLKGTRPDKVDDYTQAGLNKIWTPGSRTLKPEIIEKYKTKADPFRSYQGDIGVGQLDFAILWDDQVIYTWDAPGEADDWYKMSSSDKGLHPEVMVPSFTGEESEKLKKITTDVNAVIDPAIDKFVLGQSTMADWDKAVADARKAGAEEWEKIYNEAEARG